MFHILNVSDVYMYGGSADEKYASSEDIINGSEEYVKGEGRQ